eukprot:scaffold174715_cov29-Tisochrysis_lutea.AAC.2
MEMPPNCCGGNCTSAFGGARLRNASVSPLRAARIHELTVIRSLSSSRMAFIADAYVVRAIWIMLASEQCRYDSSSGHVCQHR